MVNPTKNVWGFHDKDYIQNDKKLINFLGSLMKSLPIKGRDFLSLKYWSSL
jgi:hypothetical protein